MPTPEKTPHTPSITAPLSDFDERYPIAVMDGDCVLCSWVARLIGRWDRSGEVRICPAQSPLGQRLLQRHGLSLSDPETWLYLEQGRVYVALAAVIQLGRRLGLLGWGLQVLRLLPLGAQNRLYYWVATHRYRWFGRQEMCLMADARLRGRLLE